MPVFRVFRGAVHGIDDGLLFVHGFFADWLFNFFESYLFNIMEFLLMQVNRGFSFQELEDGLKTCILDYNIVESTQATGYHHDGQT